MEPGKIRVSLYEDNQALRLGLSHLIKVIPEFEFTGAYPNPVKILADIQEKKPDVILMDIDMPGMSGIEATALVYKNFPEVKVVMQTVFDESEKIFRSICAGAVGYVLKNAPPEELIDAIKLANEGGVPMTPSIASKVLHVFRTNSLPGKTTPAEKPKLSDREKEVLSFLAIGLSYKMIAKECNITIDTVRFHIKNIYEALHVHSMTEAVSRAFRDNLLG